MRLLAVRTFTVRSSSSSASQALYNAVDDEGHQQLRNCPYFRKQMPLCSFFSLRADAKTYYTGEGAHTSTALTFNSFAQGPSFCHHVNNCVPLRWREIHDVWPIKFTQLILPAHISAVQLLWTFSSTRWLHVITKTFEKVTRLLI